MANMSEKHKGFTIVELLIIFVITAIIAAILLVSYSGIQARAQATQNTLLAKAFTEAITKYVIERGSYPPNTSFNYGYFCLGDYYKDVDGDGSTDCAYDKNNANPMPRNRTFNDALRPYINVDSKASNYMVKDINDSTLMGVQLWFDTGNKLDGQPYLWLMYYAIPDGETCTYGKILSEVGYSEYSTTSPSRGYTYQDKVGRGCMIALPNPSKL